MNTLSIEELKCLQSRVYAATLGGLSLEDGKKATAAIAELIAIRELKGDQVPVGEVVRVLRGLRKVTDVVWKGGKVPEAGTKLFTAPQKPVVPVGFLFVVKATGAVIYSIADAAIEGTQLIGKI